jgi:hypothetical protein
MTNTGIWESWGKANSEWTLWCVEEGKEPIPFLTTSEKTMRKHAGWTMVDSEHNDFGLFLRRAIHGWEIIEIEGTEFETTEDEVWFWRPAEMSIGYIEDYLFRRRI